VTDDIDPFLEDDAAYVMGALSPEERQAFEEHLAGCSRCTQAVAELSEVTARLDKVPLERVLKPTATREPPPDLLLPRLLDAVRTQRRRRSLWLVASGAVAASLVALAVWVGVGQAGSEQTPVADLAMTPVGSTAVVATVELTPAEWGTRVSLDCRWTPTPDVSTEKVFRLVAVPRGAGQPQVLAQWALDPGQDAQVAGSTDLAADEIASLELRAVADDAVLMRATPVVTS
jgi:hypothetical protein